MKMIQIIPNTRTWKIVDITDNQEKRLEQYYKLLDCSLIDITNQKIGDKYYDIIFDDEFMDNPKKIPSAATATGNPVLFGSLLICNYDYEIDDGNESGLTRSDIINIINNLVNYHLDDGRKGLAVVLK